MRLHIYLVIISCALFAIFWNPVRRRLVLPKKFLTVCRRTKHTVFIYKREYYMFLVPLHDIHFKIIWPEEKNALNRLFCVRNEKFLAVLQPYFRWENWIDDLTDRPTKSDLRWERGKSNFDSIIICHMSLGTKLFFCNIIWIRKIFYFI